METTHKPPGETNAGACFCHEYSPWLCRCEKVPKEVYKKFQKQTMTCDALQIKNYRNFAVKLSHEIS